LSYYGNVCDKYINNINVKYENVVVDKYVIMPNHIHLIIFINGTMRASSPTKNIEIIIRSLKALVSKEIGESIWQRSFLDHIIRGEKDYLKIWEYIDTNVVKWEKDCFYD
jgi:REP element-mobilizing transposase RayT